MHPISKSFHLPLPVRRGALYRRDLPRHTITLGHLQAVRHQRSLPEALLAVRADHASLLR